MLAAQGIAQRLDEQQADALALFSRYLLDPAWQETLQLAIGFIGVIQRRPKVAGELLQELLPGDVTASQADTGRSAIFAGKALLDMGVTNLGRTAALQVEATLVQTMQTAAYPIRTRRDAGDLLGRLGWTPEPEEGDVLLAPAGSDPTGLDAFRSVPGRGVWDGSGNVWEWMNNPHESSDTEMPLRGGGWSYDRQGTRVSSRTRRRPEYFFAGRLGVRVVVASVLQ